MGLFCPSKSKQRFRLLIIAEALARLQLYGEGKASFPFASRIEHAALGTRSGRPSQARLLIIAKVRVGLLLNGKGKV
jgi:hypothetical protein